MTWPRPWKHRLEISHIWKDESLKFNETRDAIVAAIKAAPFYDEDYDSDIYMMIEELEDARDADEFDFIWQYFYDWCDDERVWVEIYK